MNNEQRSSVGPLYLYDQKAQFQIDFLTKKVDLQRDQTFLDIGCGVLRGGIPIIRYLNKDKYCGIDLDSELIKVSQLEIQKDKIIQKKNPSLFVVSDFSIFKPPYQIEIAFAHSVLIHTEDEIVEQLFKNLREWLVPGGKIYFNVNLGVYRQTSSWKQFPVLQRPLEFYKNLAEKYHYRFSQMGKIKDLKLGYVFGVSCGDDQEMIELQIK